MKQLLLATLLSASALMITNPTTAQVQDQNQNREMSVDNQKKHKMHKMRDGGMSNFGRALRKLDLTAEQKDKISQIKKNKKAENRNEFKELHDLYIQLDDVRFKQNFDSNKAQNLIKQISEKRAQIDLENFNTEKQIYEILTAEQKQQLQKIVSERSNKNNKK